MFTISGNSSSGNCRRLNIVRQENPIAGVSGSPKINVCVMKTAAEIRAGTTAHKMLKKACHRE
jgi:hypothetical protein